MNNNTMVFDSRLKREYYILSEDNNTVYFYSYTWIDEFKAYAPSENYTFKLDNEGYKNWSEFVKHIRKFGFKTIEEIKAVGTAR